MIYALTCEKGGVGKTTTAEALGDGLRERGRSVLTIDADPQTNITAAMSADRSKPTLYDVFMGECSAADAIQTTGRGDLIPGDRNLALIHGSPRQLRDALQPIRGRYDYIVIDCPPAMGTLSINALTAADAAIIPVEAAPYSLQALGSIRATVQTVQERSNPALKIRGILICHFFGRTVVNRDIARMIEDAAAKLDTTTFKTKIRECSAIRTAQANRQSIFSYAPRSNAAKDYAAFIDELTAQDAPHATFTGRAI